MSRVDIEREIIEILGRRHFDNIQKWYTDVINQKCRYLVFMNSRCYSIVSIFEKLTNNIMIDTKEREVLTDSSFFLRCNEMADFFNNNGHFPSIVLCIDLLIHGRGLNSFIKSLQLSLYSLLPNIPKDEIDNSLIRSIQINVYARVDSTLMLNNKYEMRLVKYCILTLRQVNQLSYALSSLIIRLNASNSSYIFSEYISNEQYNSIDKTSCISTTYQNVSQNIWVEFIGNDKEKKGIGTIRIISNKHNKGYYRVIPLVLLPNLNGEETNIILRELKYRLPDIDLDKLNSFNGRRMLNELITLVFSSALLNWFNDLNKIQYDNSSREEDLRKLVRNYNYSGYEKTYELISRIVNKDIISWSDIKGIINTAVSSERKVINISDTGLGLSSCEIKDYLEDKYYELASSKEIGVYESASSLQKYMEESYNRRVYGNGFTLRNTMNGFNEVEAKYGVSYFLHMVDLGMLELSSYPSNSISVVGFAQFIESHKSAHLIWVLRVIEWIPLIVCIEQECKYSNKDFNKELNDFNRYENEYLDLNTVQKIIHFKSLLDSYGETADDWYFSMFLRKELTMSEIDFLTLQQSYVDKYIKFRKREL